MKITDVKTYALHTPLTQPFAFSQGWVHKRSATIVEISTDAGITGWGEAFSNAGWQSTWPESAATASSQYRHVAPASIGAKLSP